MTNTENNSIEQNQIRNNNIGVASHSSTGPQIRENNITGNSLAGVTLVNTDSSLIEGNSVTGSRNGIFLDAQSTKNTLVSNNASKNDIDINNADGLPLNVNGNELQSNNCSVSQPSGYCITK